MQSCPCALHKCLWEWRLGVELQFFLMSALDEGDWSVSRPVHFNPEETAHCAHCTGGFGGPRGRSGRVQNSEEQEEVSCSLPRIQQQLLGRPTSFVATILPPSSG